MTTMRRKFPYWESRLAEVATHERYLGIPRLSVVARRSPRPLALYRTIFKDELEGNADAMRRWIEAARDAGIDAIGLTDHNTAEAILPIQNVALTIDLAPVVFPGVELTTNDGCHLLLLMDPLCNQQHVNDLLSRCRGPGKRPRQENSAFPSECRDDFGENAAMTLW